MVKTILKIDGMMCQMCEAHLNMIIRDRFIVKKVSSSYKKKETIIISENNLDKQLLQKIINDTGYKIESLQETNN